MRSTLYIKFCIIYLIFGFIAVFTVATLSSELTYSRLEKTEVENLSQQASILGSDVLPSFFVADTNVFNEESSDTLKLILQSMQTSLDSSVWIVDSKGSMLAYGISSIDATPPISIDGFNPVESGTAPALTGDYHGYLNKNSYTVIAPITVGFYTPGYVLIHKTYDYVESTYNATMQTQYLTLLIIYVLSFIILLAFHFLIYRPLRKITEAATQYASGNLEYEIPVYTHDEMGYLSASLNYMSSQLKDMEDYQKKFIGNVSHDFRSPLTSINGYVTALADGTIPHELQEKYFNIILFETERLTDLTKDLLSLNEFDTKELLLNKEGFDLHEMIKNVATSFEGTCTTKRISIELLLASKHLSVFADKRKVQQILYNLIDNAIKFSSIDSSITVETTEVNEKIFVSIKDYGMGIPKENINKIWERFYKSDLSRGKDKKGTGLGLAIVKEIINAHNENINVISTEGVGTEFIFSLSRPKNTTT
ncbi:MAG: HAMP domain-containing sensor histidine kinase [Eubacteriales bacterium]